MKYAKKFGWLIASAAAVFLTSQFLAAQIVGPPVFTPQMTVSPGFLTVTTGPTSVQDLTINGTCTGCVGAANFANPTGTIGLTAVNGSAITGIRSDGAPALSQAIAPTWSATHIFASSGAGTPAVSMQSAAPSLRWLETDAAADNQWWDIIPVSEQLRFRTRNDANNNGIDFMTVDRTGITVDSIVLNSSALSITGQSTFSSAAGGGSSAPVYISNTSPAWSINETDAGTDDKRWDFIASAEQLAFRTVNDANSSVANWLTVDRTDLAIDSIALTGTTISHLASVMELENATPQFQVDETDAASNERNWLYRSSAGALAISTATDAAPTTAVANALVIDRTGTTVDSFAISATTATVNGANIATETQGTFTASFGNACTTTPTIDFDYTKTGNTVTIEAVATTGFTCTGDSTGFSSGTNVPANIRPAVAANSAVYANGGCQNNGTVTACCITIDSTGIMFLSIFNGTVCNGSGWTASGNRSATLANVNFTYMLGNP